ncbi:MAG: hypothetical protein HY898_19180 [Deltaproteobacteria bacterium]|nr:hypothetical protein [Deltaproteobacteria bacterium]
MAHDTCTAVGRLPRVAAWLALSLVACGSATPAASTTDTRSVGPTAAPSTAPTAAPTTTPADAAPGAAGSAKVWTECPPPGAAPEGGMVNDTTYRGQPCSGDLHCTWYYADCPGLSGFGPSCDCVSNKFVCVSHTCAGK